MDFKTIKDEYLTFLEAHTGYNSACSGIGSCDFCNKNLYPMRTKYLKAYAYYYKNNKESCPRLQWACADTAKEWIAGDFHKTKCNSGKDILSCDCELSKFLKVAYPDINETTIIKSLGDQIYPIVKKILRLT